MNRVEKLLLVATLPTLALAVFLPPIGVLWVAGLLAVVLVLAGIASSGRNEIFVLLVPLAIFCVAFPTVQFIIIGVLSWPVIWLFPTALNLLATYFAVRFLPLPRILKFVLALPVSLVLGVNLRWPAALELIADSGSPVTTVGKQLRLGPNDYLSVESNHPQWFVRPWLFDTYGIGISEAVSVWWERPAVIVERAEDSLLASHIPFANNTDSQKRLVLTTSTEGSFINLKAAIFDGSEELSSTSVRRRFRSPFERVAADKIDMSDLETRIAYILYQNLWNQLILSMESHLTTRSERNQDLPRHRILNAFLARAVIEEVPTRQYQVVGQYDYFEKFKETKETQCSYGFNGSPNDGSHTFSNGNAVKLAFLGGSRISFTSKSGIRNEFRTSSDFAFLQALCYQDEIAIAGFMPGNNRLENGVVVVWLNTIGARQAEAHISLPPIQPDWSRRVVRFDEVGDCLALRMRTRNAPYWNVPGTDDLLTYLACPSDQR